MPKFRQPTGFLKSTSPCHVQERKGGYVAVWMHGYNCPMDASAGKKKTPVQQEFSNRNCRLFLPIRHLNQKITELRLL